MAKENAQSLMDSLIVANKIENELNRIDPTTIQETRSGVTPLGGGSQALFEGKTHGGDIREIYRIVGGFPTKERKNMMLTNLIKQIYQNPDFADTLTAETRPDIKTELNYSGKPFRYLKNLFGF